MNNVLFTIRSLKRYLFPRVLTMASSSTSEIKRKPNRLIKEKSSYLLQHAYNTVDWYPWGQEAFDRAKKENRLIFLSVGYSTCHWCHVMERESFENEQIGEIMNKSFVAIKVDREERPDVDKMYMTFIQAISGSGGWPMSVFLTPDLRPITGGTYFPPTDAMGRPGFRSILDMISKQWHENHDQMMNQGIALTSALMQAVIDTAGSSDHSPLPSTVTAMSDCYKHLDTSFDGLFGGFARAPKFPQPSNMEFLLRCYHCNKDDRMGKSSLEMVETTLKRMANGGIHDHVGQGFHRYAVDQRWHVPHFEKMLYDQAQLAVLYADAYQITKENIYADIVRDILLYVDRDLSHPAGGFYSAEDADSFPTQESKEKREGAFCVWSWDELKTVLCGKVDEQSNISLFEVFTHHFSVKEGGNTNPQLDPHGELLNQNVLVSFDSIETTAKKFNLSVKQTEEALEKSKNLLYQLRQKRPRPHLDDKIITAWNGLMISGFSKATSVLDEQKYAERAEKAARFIKSYLTNPDGTLLRSTYNDKSSQTGVGQKPHPINAFADDYAFLIGGLLDLYECTFNSDWLKWAEELQNKMDDLFWDEGNESGYFLSTNKDKSILIRMKEDQDGAEPSTNSAASMNLVRLSILLDNSNYKERARRIFMGFEQRLTKVPYVLPKMVCSLALFGTAPTQVVIAGSLNDPKTRSLINTVNDLFLPDKALILLNGETDQWLKEKVKHVDSLTALDGKPTAYVCQNFSCSLPVHTSEELTKILVKAKE